MPCRGTPPSTADPPPYMACLQLAGELCVVVGGGAVASRKVEALLESGARVRVVSPAITLGLRKLVDDRRVEWQAREYAAGDAVGARLAFAATDRPEVNQLVAAEARAAGVWVNIADGSDEGDFRVPATLRRGELTVAIATGGSAPGYARRLREWLETVIGPEYGEALALYARARAAILTAPRARQVALWNRLFALDLPTVVRTEGREAGEHLLAEWREREGLL